MLGYSQVHQPFLFFWQPRAPFTRPFVCSGRKFELKPGPPCRVWPRPSPNLYPNGCPPISSGGPVGGSHSSGDQFGIVSAQRPAQGWFVCTRPCFHLVNRSHQYCSQIVRQLPPFSAFSYDSQCVSFD